MLYGRQLAQTALYQLWKTAQTCLRLLAQQIVLRMIGKCPQELLDARALRIEMFPVIQQGDGAIKVEQQD